MNLSDIHPVTEFRAMLEGCEAYPDDVVAVPEPLAGTSAFPASSGLVRPAGSSELPPFPYGGLMVIGHDVDSLDLHEDRRNRGIADGDVDHGLSATWFGLYRLLDLGGVAHDDVYVTSLYVGLKRGPSVGAFTRHPSAAFTTWCDRFLEHQVRVMRPSVMLVLGSVTSTEIMRHCATRPWAKGRLPAPGHRRIDVCGQPTLLLAAKHPSMPGRIRADGLALAAAWDSPD
jgi:hypothetical protein